MSKSSIASFRHKTIQSRATLYILAVDSSAFARIRGVNVHRRPVLGRWSANLGSLDLQDLIWEESIESVFWADFIISQYIFYNLKEWPVNGELQFSILRW